MKIVGLIPSRLESSRFPNKPLVDILGKSMILRVYEQAIQAKILDDVFVITDSEEIAEEINSNNGKVIKTSSSPRNGTERCAEALQILNDSYDVVINIQGDEPFIQPEQIDLLADMMRGGDVELGTLVLKDNRQDSFESESNIKVVLDNDMRAMYFSRSPIPRGANEFYRHIGMYAYRKDTLKEIVAMAPSELELIESLEQLRWLENGKEIYVALTDIDSESIDTPEDLQNILEKYSTRNV